MKKKLLSVLIALALLLGLAPAALAEVGAALPEAGDVVHGFEVIETRDYPLMNAVIVRFEHQKTGAELYWIANDDINRAFDLTFFTEAIDNTGLPHVFEHATIQGSEKYPGEQMFFNLKYQTYNTFMNALTSQWLTSYPVASLSEAQLLKLAQFYTDGCFHPIIMENEHIFRTEAWRYRLENPEDALSIEGTVYSEMLGAMNLKRQAFVNLLRAAFPGSMAGNVATGDPEFIPDMTWQALKDYHDLYYHPSNCAAYLYGQFEDYAAFLELLDGYFSAYERREFTRNDSNYAPITEPVELSLPYAVEAGASTEHASSVLYAFVCPGLRQNQADELVLDTMTDLFLAKASDLQQHLLTAMPYGSFSASIEMNGPEDAILFVAEDVDSGDAQTFKAIVDEELARVAENGFPQALVDSVASSLAISARLVRENSNPVESIIVPMVNRYATSGNPWDQQDYQDGLFSINDWNSRGMYARAVSDWLLNSQTTALVTTWPEPGAKERKDAALAERLAEIKAGMTEDEIAGIVEATNAEAPEDHSAEYVEQLKAVTVQSLPEEIKRYDVSDGTDADGIRHIDVKAAVEGISQVDIFLDISSLPQEDIHWFVLYTHLINALDTSAHTRAELASLFSRYLYNGIISLELPEDGEGGYHPSLRMSWLALDEDLAAGYDLVRELVFDTRVDEPEKLMEQVRSIRSGMKNSITANPVSLLLVRSLARGREAFAYSSFATGVAYYEFLDEVEQLLAQDPDAVVAKLQGIQKALNNRTNAVTMCAGSDESIALNRRLREQFLASLDARDTQRAEYDFPVPAAREALIIDSGVQFNLLVCDLESLGLEAYDGSLDAVCKLVSDTFLVPMLRDRYGVYTPWNGINENYFMIYTFRDPNIAETFKVLHQLPELVAGLELDQDTLDGYIMSAYSDYATPLGELTGAATAAVDVLQGLDPARRLDYMRQLKRLTPDTLRAKADLYAKLNEAGAWMTAGAASAINANADLFDAVLNPFGAVDNTRVALNDVTEGGDHYDAVRFAFEQGLMAPLSGDAFGVDEPATQGDLLTALYVLLGGERDADAALAAFAGYGLVGSDTDLSAPIAPGDIQSLVSALTGQAAGPLADTAASDAVTRGELAEALLALMQE